MRVQISLFEGLHTWTLQGQWVDILVRKNRDIKSSKASTVLSSREQSNLVPNPEGPSTQIVGFQGPKPIQSMDLGTQNPTIWVLGPSGKHLRPATLVQTPTLNSISLVRRPYLPLSQKERHLQSDIPA